MKITAASLFLLATVLAVVLLNACVTDIPPETARACMPSETTASQLSRQVPDYMLAQVRTDGIMDESFLVGTRYRIRRNVDECAPGISLDLELPTALTPRNKRYLKALFHEGVNELLE